MELEWMKMYQNNFSSIEVGVMRRLSTETEAG